MNRCAATVFTATLTAFVAATASADPISITLDRRSTIVLANTSDANGADRHTATTQGSDSLSAAAAASTGTSSGASNATLQSSFADPMHWSGSGAADVSWSTQGMADYSALSEFAVTFQLDSALSFAFSGTFAGSSFNSGPPLLSSDQARWSAALVRSNGGSILFNDSGMGAASRTFTGVLLPGEYRFLVNAAGTGFITRDGGNGASREAMDFTFDLAEIQTPPPSPTPEPASMLLLGTGVTGLFAARRKRRTEAPSQ